MREPRLLDHRVGSHGGRGHVCTTAAVDGRSGIPPAPPIAWALERLKSFIRSIRSSLNRRFGGLLSTGFKRATSICGKVPVGRIVADSCARAASDDAAANTPNRLMNARQETEFVPRHPGLSLAHVIDRDRW